MSNFGDKPFGLREVTIQVGAATPVPLPVDRVFKFKERVRSGELSGSDKINSVVAFSEAAEWEIEQGGISLEAYAALTGRTVVSSGTTPNQTKTVIGLAQAAFPYVKIRGRALGEGLDDVWCTLNKCKATDSLEGSFQDGQFFMMSCKGIAVDDGSAEGIFRFLQHETAATLPTS